MMEQETKHPHETDQMPKPKSGKGAVVALVIVIVLAIAALGGLWYFMNNKAKNDKKASDAQIQQLQKQLDELKIGKSKQEVATITKNLKQGTFGEAGDFGTFQAEGHPTIVKTNEAFCEANCKQYDYILFNITRIENPKFLDYLKKLNGNNATGINSIGIGCLTSGQINYSNDSDQTGMKEYSISKEDSSKIMIATATNPIILDFDKLKYTGGRGAPTCYSHISTIKVVN